MKRKHSYLFRHFGQAFTKDTHAFTLLRRFDKGDISLCVRRVLEGIEWLESNGMRDWKQKLATCDVMNCMSCALASATGIPYGASADKYGLGLDRLVAYGFHPGGPCNKTETLGALLTVLWRTAATH